MPHKDLEKRREYQRRYQREWRRRNPLVQQAIERRRNVKHKTTRNHYSRSYLKRRKEFLRALKGDRGCCQCGEKDPRVLEFHHRDPQQKKFCVNAGTVSEKWADVMDELAKCDVLCANCHARHHAELRGDLWP